MKHLAKNYMDFIEDKVAAYHEAGHAVIAIYYNHRIVSVGIDRDSLSFGRVISKDPFQTITVVTKNMIYNDRKFFTYNLEEIQMCLAGDIAKKMMLKKINATFPSEGSGEGDLKESEQLIKNLCVNSESFAEMQALYIWLEERTKTILDWYWPQVEAIAQELLIKKKISGARARKIYWETHEAEMEAELKAIQGGAR